MQTVENFHCREKSFWIFRVVEVFHKKIIPTLLELVMEGFCGLLGESTQCHTTVLAEILNMIKDCMDFWCY